MLGQYGKHSTYRMKPSKLSQIITFHPIPFNPFVVSLPQNHL